MSHSHNMPAPVETMSRKLMTSKEIRLTLPPLPKIDLRDAHAIRREIAAVYRDMRAGSIASQDGTRLAYVLDIIRKAHETAVLQDRIELLERTIEHRRG